MTSSITEFKGQYRYLSNFYPCNVVDGRGNVWPSSEHLYQGMKTTDGKVQKVIREFPFKGLKQIGKSIELRPDWNEIRVDVMRAVVRLKFRQNSDIKEQLLSTGIATMIEGNYWHDNFWGNCYCNNSSGKHPECILTTGANQLGTILMEIRAELRKSSGHVVSLKPNEIFVFGSNLAGRHGKGTALQAKNKFGAVYGVGYGRTGQCYAIPTKDEQLRVLPIQHIAKSVGQFIIFAEQQPELTFLVTEIGCGLAGYKPDQIAPLFKKAETLENIKLPITFMDILRRQ